jgi:hypothetical protein
LSDKLEGEGIDWVDDIYQYRLQKMMDEASDPKEKSMLHKESAKEQEQRRDEIDHKGPRW